MKWTEPEQRTERRVQSTDGKVRAGLWAALYENPGQRLTPGRKQIIIKKIQIIA
jgi:hypothetical protein